MGTEIYYFSGTGNSLHVTRELQRRIPEAELIPIVSLLNKEFVEPSSDSVGFVFPIHLMMAPAFVIKFLKKLDLRSANYIFAVATRAGTQHRAFIDVENILKKKDKSLDSFFTLNMPSNDPKFEGWQAAIEEEIAKLEFEVQNKLDSIGEIVINKKKSREKDTNFIDSTYGFPILALVLPFFLRFYNVEFYPDSKCAGCGTCEKVCLSGKIKMVNGKPAWQKDVQCFFCNACINYCPKHAVQVRSNKLLKSYTDKNERYSHPYATADDIAGQKGQG